MKKASNWHPQLEHTSARSIEKRLTKQIADVFGNRHDAFIKFASINGKVRGVI